MAPNTIVSIVPEVCQAIYDHYHDTAFKCPTTADEWKDVARGFSEKWDFHHCCGCIDGKHVRIKARGLVVSEKIIFMIFSPL